MSAPLESKAVAVSLRCYQRLLAVYPERHRREYGFPMAQLFHDQCRDAWRASRSWGLIRLWLRVLPDLVRTSFLEHIAAIKGRKSMVEKISDVTKINPAPLKTFFAVFAVVFLAVFGTCAVVTFLLPESFRSTVRVKVERGPSATAGKDGSAATSNGYDPYFLQTELEVIQSRVVLGKVIEALGLNAKWSRRYAGGEKLRTTETLTLLRGRMDLRPVRNTTLVEISVYGDDRDETAAIANAIAEAYHDHRLQQQSELAQRGVAALRSQFDEQEQKVRDAQKEVDQLRRELNISDGTGNAPSPTIDADVVQRLQGELISAKTMLAREETSLNELIKLTPDRRRDALQTSVGPDSELNTLLAECNLAEQRLLSAQREYAPDHPTHQSLKAMAEDSSKRVTARVEGVIIGLSNRVASMRASVDRLTTEMETARQTDIKNAEAARPYYQAKRGLEELQRFQTLLSLKMASEKLDMTLPRNVLAEIIDRAEPAFRPVRPNKPLNLLIAAIVAILSGVISGGAATWGRFRTRRKALSDATPA